MGARRPLTMAMLIGVLAGGAAPAQAALFDTTLVSRATGPAGAKGTATSERPAISADGRFVAFHTLASLTPADADGNVDVYVRDLQTGTTTLVSQSGGAKGNGGSVRPSISADGLRVAFHSNSTNLHPDDTNPDVDVYVRDLQAATTMLVSRASGAAGVKGNGDSSFPAISADGRHVAFRGSSTNLGDDPDTTTDVHVRDLQTATTVLVSRASGVGGAKGNEESLRPAISGDGRYIAFETEASNLHPDDTDAVDDIMVRDVETATTTLVSRAGGAGGVKGNGGTQRPSISADGRFVAFYSNAGNLHPDATVTSAGDVLVRDLQTSTVALASRATGASGAKANTSSEDPVLSPDGRFVTFATFASNLDPADAGMDGSDIFMRDLQEATTALVSRASGPNGVNSNGQAFEAAAVSTGGRVVAFKSGATNLHPDDTDATLDVFAREMREAAAVVNPPPAVPPAGPSGTTQPGGGAAVTVTPPPVAAVTPPPVAVNSSLSFRRVTVKRNCTATVQARVSGAGRLTATARARVRSPGSRKLRSLTVAKRTVRPTRGGTATLKLKCSKKARSALKRTRGKLRARVTLTFLPAAGQRRAKAKSVTFRLKP